MRSILTFPCEGAQLSATLDDAPGSNGLLIVSGGNEIRIGAHRGMAKLATDVAAKGHPVFRFDRRGIGDSEGENAGFRGSGPDIAAALNAFRAACPHLETITGFGNCDAATALVLHKADIQSLILANPWVIEPADDLPPPAAIKARYLDRIRDPKAWLRLFTGGMNIGKALRGLARVAAPPSSAPLADEFFDSLGVCAMDRQISLLLAEGDATAIAFSEAITKSKCRDLEEKGQLKVTRIQSNSHSFAGDADYRILVETISKALA